MLKEHEKNIELQERRKRTVEQTEREPLRAQAKEEAEQFMDAFGVELGMKVGEVGAGDGRYVVHAARRVGNSGKIFAEDIDEKALDKLRHRCQRERIENVEIILGTVTDPLLPNKELDIVYVINAYFLFEKPVELLKNIAPSLKPGGSLVIAESAHVTPKDDIIEKANQSGFKLNKVTSLTYESFNVCIFAHER